MRVDIDADPSDDRYNVYLNNKEVKYCVIADSDKGYVTVLDPESPTYPFGRLERQTYYGEVRIEHY